MHATTVPELLPADDAVLEPPDEDVDPAPLDDAELSEDVEPELLLRVVELVVAAEALLEELDKAPPVEVLAVPLEVPALVELAPKALVVPIDAELEVEAEDDAEVELLTDTEFVAVAIIEDDVVLAVEPLAVAAVPEEAEEGVEPLPLLDADEAELLAAEVAAVLVAGDDPTQRPLAVSQVKPLAQSDDVVQVGTPHPMAATSTSRATPIFSFILSP